MNYVQDLNFCHFNTSSPGDFQKHASSAYRLWETEWKETFKQANWPVELYSDDFIHRELGGLFSGTRAIGFLLYTFLDFSTLSTRHARYFKNYPSQVWQNHFERGDYVMAPTYMTLDREWRRSKTNLPVSELLFSFATLRFLESPADRLIAYARNDLKMNEGFYRHGAKPLAQNVNLHETLVDFIEISRENAHLSTDDLCAEMALMLWNKTRTQNQPQMETVLQKREGKNHVITLYQPENGTYDSGTQQRSLGKPGVLPGLARTDLLLHPLQHPASGLRGRMVTE